MAGADARPARPGSDLEMRAIVGAALALAAATALWFGGIVLWLFVGAVALIALGEWSMLVGVGEVRRLVALAGLGAALVLAAPFAWGPERTSVAALVGVAMVLMLTFGRAWLAAGLIYIGLAAMGLPFLRASPHGLMLALWTIIVVILTDTGAYFAGRAIGGAKLAPSISPGKTWSGLGGGVAAALIGGALVGRLGGLAPATMWLGAPLALLAQGGDLFESALKRRAGVKDSGRLLPGHGGFLDRIDGALPVVILVAAIAAEGLL